MSTKPVDACEERRGSSSAELAQNRTDAKNKLKGAIGKVKQQVEKNPAGFTLQNMSHEPEGEVIKEEEKENPTFVQFMKRIDQLPEVTREAIKNCGNDPAIAKAALEISGIDK